MMGWLIALAVLTLIGFIRVGVQARYDVEGVLVRLLLGPVKLTLLPSKKKPVDGHKKPAGEAKKKKAPEADPIDKLPTDPPPAPKPKEKPGGPVTDFLPLVKVALDLVGDFFSRLHIQNLQLKLVLAGDDPCDLAVNYGRAWAALGNLAGLLDNALHIKKRDLEILCDFEAEQTLVTARADITISIGRICYLLVRYGYRGLKEFIKFKNKRKGGAVK